MNNTAKNIRAKLNCLNSETKKTSHDLNDLLKDKELVGEQANTYITFEKNPSENHTKLSKLEEISVVDNMEELDQLYAKTSSLLKKTNQQINAKDNAYLNTSIDNQSINNSRLSVSADKITIVKKSSLKRIDIEDQPFDITKVNPIINTSNNNTFNNIYSDNSFLNNNVDESFKSNYSNGNLHINQSMKSRLMDKIKSIKILEKELREKNSIIESLNKKIEMQRILIERLNEKDDSKMKSKLVNLKNIIKDKDQENNVMIEKFKELINEYQDKMKKLFENQVILLRNVKVLNSKISELNEENSSLKEDLHFSENYKESFDVQMKNLKENFEETLKEKQKMNEKLTSMTSCVKILVNQIISSKQSFNSLNESSSRIYRKLKDLMIEEESIVESIEI